MKKVMVKNMKLILGIIIGVVLSGTISVYALYIIHAKDVSFTSTNENFNAGNVNDALDYLYGESRKVDFYIKDFLVQISATNERGVLRIPTNGRTKLSIGQRTYDNVLGETYFNILGYFSDNCSEDEEYERFLHTTSQSTTKEVFDISKYACIQIAVRCENPTSSRMVSYKYNDIRLYNE